MARRAQSISIVDQLRQMRASYGFNRQGDYAAAKTSRYRRPRSQLGGAGDAHLDQYAHDRIREFGRDMDRNDMLIGQMFDRYCDSVVANGYTLEPDTGDPAVDKAIKDEHFGPWADDPNQCDITGEMSFADMQWFSKRAEAVDGDIFALGTREGSLQLWEGDRCQSPYSVVNRRDDLIIGVQLDAVGKPIEYWFNKEWRRDRHANVMGDVVRIPACNADGLRQVFHVLSRQRISQTRGLSVLKAVFDTCGMFEDINFAMIVKQQIAALFGVFLKTTQQQSSAANVALGPRSTFVGGQNNADTMTEEELRPGMVTRLPYGVEPHEFASKIPGEEFMAHMKFLVRIIGIQLGMPLFMTLMDSSETVFHGYRGEIDLHRRSALVQQQGFIERFHAPIYRWKMNELAKTDNGLKAALKKLGARFFKHSWKPAKWPYIHPIDDAKGAELRKNNLQVSPSSLAAETGDNFQQIIAETVRDNGIAIRAAIKEAKAIKQETSVEVPWTLVLRLTAGQKDTPDALAMGEKVDPITGQPLTPTPSGKKKRRKAAGQLPNRMAAHLNGVVDHA